jgi:hypothetical protein
MAPHIGISEADLSECYSYSKM